MKTFLPIFNGFYNTNFDRYNENMDYIYESIAECRTDIGLPKNFEDMEVDFNNDEYENDVAKELCNIIKGRLSDFIESITFENVYNPKVYNFSNDSINCDIVPNIDNIKNYIYANISFFKSYLKAKYSSCDGFISHYENDFESWVKYTKDFSDYSGNEHYLGSVLQFISDNENIKEFDIYLDFVESDIDVMQYVKNYDEIVNQQDGSLYEFLIVKEYESNYAEYLHRTFENGLIDAISLNCEVQRDLAEYKLLLTV